MVIQDGSHWGPYFDRDTRVQTYRVRYPICLQGMRHKEPTQTASTHRSLMYKPVTTYYGGGGGGETIYFYD